MESLGSGGLHQGTLLMMMMMMMMMIMMMAAQDCIQHIILSNVGDTQV